MDKAYLISALCVFGACFGSFAGASVWRLRSKQLSDDKSNGEKINKKDLNEIKKIDNHSVLTDRSKCLSCGYKLNWYDLMPILSWFVLRGRCRKCNKPIGYTELFVELAMAAFFILSFLMWPLPLSNTLELARFILWLIAGVALAILFIYDAKWFILPNVANYSIIVLGILNTTIILLMPNINIVNAILSALGSVVIMGGFYLLIYVASAGKWIGFGDVKLGFGLGLMLADWKLALMALFLANMIGCLIVIPLMLAGKLNRSSRVPFGPLFILGFIIAGLLGGHLVNILFYNL